ncbi:hypothetical protein [Streptosporangium sp. NPDC002524]|uniref:hypothetical protein n=1 Tax=Streptosporangium sp. NPDC002524 TaxID=3154537 RepID=UPI003322237C
MDTDSRRSPVDGELIKRLYLEGLSVRQIAAQTPWGPGAVHKSLIRERVPRRLGRGGGQRIPAAVRQQVLQAYKEGELVADIATRLKVSRQSVSLIAMDAGLASRPRGGRRELDVWQVAVLASQEMSVTQVAEQVGFSHGHVRREMRQLGFVREELPELPAAEELRAMFARVGSVRGVARELGCSADRAKGALERAGVQVPTRARREVNLAA